MSFHKLYIHIAQLVVVHFDVFAVDICPSEEDDSDNNPVVARDTAEDASDNVVVVGDSDIHVAVEHIRNTIALDRCYNHIHKVRPLCVKKNCAMKGRKRIAKFELEYVN